MTQDLKLSLSDVILNIQIKCLSVQTIAILFLPLLLVMLFIGTLNAEAASVYFVRAGATGAGNGSDWSNAYTSLPASLERGATYYIADGSYGSYTFDDTGSSTTYIYITKATTTDHGPATDWQASYGAGQATFSAWTFNTGYYVINGQVGGGPFIWDSGFGIVVRSTKGKRVIFNNNVSHVTISHTEITNTDNTPNDVDFGSLIYAYSNVTYITFSYCTIHHVFGCCIQTGYPGSDNWTVEYSKVGNNTGSSAHHSEIWSTMGSDNLTIRYNWLFQWRSTGALIAMNGPKGTYDDNAISESWNIYGNVFEQGGTTASWVIAAFMNASYDQFARYWTVVNNTFIDINSTASSVYLCSLANYGTSDNVFVNNIIYGNSDTMVIDGVQDENDNSYRGSGTFFTGIHDGVLSSNPFVNYSGKDYRLTGELPGISLAGEFTKDISGITRGNDGVWDRGAFEFSKSSGTRPSPPSGLRIISQ